LIYNLSGLDPNRERMDGYRFSSMGNARFPLGSSGFAFALNLCGSILNTTGPALRDLAGWGRWISLVIRIPGSDLEPIGYRAAHGWVVSSRIIGKPVHETGLKDCASRKMRWDKWEGVLASGGRSDRVTP